MKRVPRTNQPFRGAVENLTCGVFCAWHFERSLREEAKGVAAWMDKLIPYHQAMSGKWERGSYAPRAFVEADPSEPQPPEPEGIVSAPAWHIWH